MAISEQERRGLAYLSRQPSELNPVELADAWYLGLEPARDGSDQWVSRPLGGMQFDDCEMHALLVRTRDMRPLGHA